MKIVTGNEIYLEGCDIREQSESRNYDDYSTKERTKYNATKWVSVESLKKDLDIIAEASNQEVRDMIGEMYEELDSRSER